MKLHLMTAHTHIQIAITNCSNQITALSSQFHIKLLVSVRIVKAAELPELTV